jgi:pyruvate kinase
MLSGETAQGKYPVECVKVLDRVARRIALSGGAGYANDAILATQRQKTIRSAVMLANSIEDSKLVVFTRTGEMADQTSHLRPERAPIFVFTPTQEEVRHQTMNWNSHAFHLDFTTDAEETFAEAEKILIQQKLVASGDKLIVLRELIEGEERFESIQIRTVP